MRESKLAAGAYSSDWNAVSTKIESASKEQLPLLAATACSHFVRCLFAICSHLTRTRGNVLQVFMLR